MTPLAIDAGAFLVPYGAPARLKPVTATGDKTRAQAQDFESMFISSMMQHMFTGIGNDGPLGNAAGVGPWRSFLTDQYAKALVKAGGLGLANQIYKSMLARQARQDTLKTA
jgi:Rod binding domain-containing protein